MSGKDGKEILARACCGFLKRQRWFCGRAHRGHEQLSIVCLIYASLFTDLCTSVCILVDCKHD
jgi:hypothetical protein